MMEMVTLPFLVILFLLIVVFLMGVVIGATLKDQPDTSKKQEISSEKPGMVTIKIDEKLLKDPTQLEDGMVVLDFRGVKPVAKNKIKLVAPQDKHKQKPGELIHFEKINWKPPIDVKKDQIHFHETLKKKPWDKRNE